MQGVEPFGHVNLYDFYGIDGIFDDPDDEGRGVLEFKQGFNGYVVEMPGDFMKVLRPVTYRAQRLAHKLLEMCIRDRSCGGCGASLPPS